MASKSLHEVHGICKLNSDLIIYLLAIPIDLIFFQRLDTIIFIAGLIGTIYDSVDQTDAASKSKNSFSIIKRPFEKILKCFILDKSSGFEVILIMRSIRLIKLVGSFQRFRIIIDTIAIIVPSLLTYLLLILTIFYIFSMCGLEFFGHLIKDQKSSVSQVYNCQNSFLTNTDFSR